MNKFFSYILLTVIITPGFLYAGSPKYSNDFLTIGVGARSYGMGRSVIASTNDIYSTYWNPAGIVSSVKDIEIGLMHVEYPNGIAKYDFGAGLYRLGDSSGVLGFSVIRFGIDDIPNTLDLYDNQGNVNYDAVTYFSAVDYAFMLSYARKSKIKGLDYGVNIKVINRMIGEFAKAWGFGIDVGAIYQTGNWKMGISGRDITTTFNAWTFNTSSLSETFAATGNELPANSIENTLPRLLGGISRYIQLFKRFSVEPELGFDATFDGKRNELVKSSFSSVSPHLGVEFDYDHIAFFRMGISDIYKTTTFDGEKLIARPSLGVGIHFLNIDLDYAISDFGNNSNIFFSHIFSMNINFNKFKKG